MEVVVRMLLENQVVQGAIVTLILALIGMLGKKAWWVKHVMDLGRYAYDRIETHPDFAEFKGLDKLPPFVKTVLERYAVENDGQKASPEVIALAVKAMEQEVVKEHLGK